MMKKKTNKGNVPEKDNFIRRDKLSKIEIVRTNSLVHSGHNTQVYLNGQIVPFLKEVSYRCSATKISEVTLTLYAEMYTREDWE